MNDIMLKKVYDDKKRFVYKVQKGETLRTIAQKFKTTKELIININSLTKEILEGEYIVVEIIEGHEYIVEPYDTIESIAQKFSVSAQNIMIKNKIDFIFVGQKIYL